MTIQIAMGVVQFIAFVATFGVSTGAQGGSAAAQQEGKKAIANAVDKSQGAINKGWAYFKTIATNPAAKNYIQTQVANKSKMWAERAVSTLVVGQICKLVGDQIFKSAGASKPTFNLEALDPTGITSAVTTCDNIRNEADKANCAKAVLNTVTLLDPTGLVSIVAALVNPVCDV